MYYTCVEAEQWNKSLEVEAGTQMECIYSNVGRKGRCALPKIFANFGVQQKCMMLAVKVETFLIIVTQDNLCVCCFIFSRDLGSLFSYRNYSRK